ncbi:DNA cytosine methyltransferase [Actinomadura luteofluorescens]|uniref:DNA cytosine methyltransferase n=1 Tax=Actinomadura luteofluorescens TaxID=46163 RepID=UPI003555D1E3
MSTVHRSPDSRSRPIAIDLFAGAGGLSLGFEQAGFDVVAAVEYDPVHAATHLFNLPSCEVLCRDVANLSAETLLQAARAGFRKLHPRRQWPGQVDAIIGGPPCQGFSAGGKREEDDSRNQLLLHFVRLVEEVRPRALCLENVAGLLETRFDRVREEAFGRLRAAGYRLSGDESPLNCLDFGVPQSRRRVVILGILEAPAPTLVTVDYRPSVEDAFEGLPSPLKYATLLQSDEVKLDEDDIRRRQCIRNSYARQLAGLDPLSDDKSRLRRWDPAIITGARRTVHTEATIARFAATAPGSVEPKSRLYRLPSHGPSRTLRAGTGSERGAHTSPRPIHPEEDRVITVREAARLHGYPDWFRFHTTNWHGHRQIGNSVPPPLARAAAHALLVALQRRPMRLRAAVPLGEVSLLHLSRKEAQPIFNALTSEIPKARARKTVEAVTVA